MSLFGVVRVSSWYRREPRCGICGNHYDYVCQYCHEYDIGKLKSRIDELEEMVEGLREEICELREDLRDLREDSR